MKICWFSGRSVHICPHCRRPPAAVRQRRDGEKFKIVRTIEAIRTGTCALHRASESHRVKIGDRIGLVHAEYKGTENKIGWVCQICLDRFESRSREGNPA
jgi:hypothetical protein